MRRKTSLTLSEDVLAGVEKAARRSESRSETVNRLLRERLADEAAQLDRALHCDELVSLPKSRLTALVGRLATAKLQALDRALVAALDIDLDVLAAQ